jgi:hypothetical protein
MLVLSMKARRIANSPKTKTIAIDLLLEIGLLKGPCILSRNRFADAEEEELNTYQESILLR